MHWSDSFIVMPLRGLSPFYCAYALPCEQQQIDEQVLWWRPL
jgi:hypothetical protein